MKTAAFGLVLVGMVWLAGPAAGAGDTVVPADGSAAAVPAGPPSGLPGSTGATFTGFPAYTLPPTLDVHGPGYDMNPAPMALPRNEPPFMAEPGLMAAPYTEGPSLMVDPATGLPVAPPGETCTGEGGPEANAKPSEIRSGFFQRISFDATWLLRQGDAGIGMTDLELKLAVAVPMPSRDWPMLIVPGFAVHYLDAPTADLPPRVYDAYVLFRWLPKLSPQWMLDVAVTPGVYSDFQQDISNAWRTTAHGAAIYTWSPTLKLVGGVLYEDRRDWNFLPLGGILWTPTDDWDIELLFPEPKAAMRIFATSSAQTVETWVYVAGEFGDSVWAVQQPDGTANRVAYKNTRILLGVEHKQFGSVSGKVEVGYVFGQQLTYYNGNLPDLEPPGTMLLRGELRY